MKQKKSTAPVLTRNPDNVADPAEAVVEDLNQQDVLPPNDGEVISDVSEDDDTAVTQAGRWDDPASDLGHRASKQPLDDEVKATEDLVNMGVNEADEELRELDELDEEEEEKEENEEG